MAEFEVQIKRFDGGMVNDIRNGRPNESQLIENFDILSYPSSLKPYNSSESGNDTVEREIQRFAFKGSTLYGLGVDSGTAFAKIYTKTDFTGAAWNTPSNSTSAAGATSFQLFVPYTYGGNTYLYGAKGGDTIWRCIPGTSFTESYQSLTYTTIRQGLVHSKDDILYIPYDNKIASDNQGSWTAAALTLPSYLTIESICEFGNFLAILASDTRRSFVYLWDRNASLTTLSDSIDVGYGYYQILEEYEGTLIAFGEVGNNLVIKQYNSGGFTEIAELSTTVSASDPLFQPHKLKTRDRIYFIATMNIDGAVHQGIWSFGRSRKGELALSLEYTANNDTAPNTIYSFHVEMISRVLYFFTAYNDGSDKQVSKTSETSTDFSATSTYETTINPRGQIENGDIQGYLDVSKKKDLLGISVTYEPLPTAGEVIVKYKVDNDTSWTATNIDDTTDNSMSASDVSQGGALPRDWKELRLQVTSTGGAVITGIKFKGKVTGKDAY